VTTPRAAMAAWGLGAGLARGLTPAPPQVPSLVLTTCHLLSQPNSYIFEGPPSRLPPVLDPDGPGQGLWPWRRAHDLHIHPGLRGALGGARRRRGQRHLRGTRTPAEQSLLALQTMDRRTDAVAPLVPPDCIASCGPHFFDLQPTRPQTVMQDIRKAPNIRPD